MKISLTERFQKDVQNLNKNEFNQVLAILQKIPQAVKEIHKHSGVGLRKIHHSGIFEARLGLNLRLIFGYQNNEIIFHRIGNHDEIKKYLKSL